MWPTALWVQQSSERCGCVFKLAQTGNWAVGNCFALSLRLLQKSYWHTEAFYNAYSYTGYYRKVIDTEKYRLLQKSYGIVTVPCKRQCSQKHLGREGRIILVWSQRTPPEWGLLADFSVQSSASWHQLYLGRSEVLLSVYKCQPRSWHVQYPWPEKKASAALFKLHALIHRITEVGRYLWRSPSPSPTAQSRVI